MFDGSHRSRRQVDLSGNSGRNRRRKKSGSGVATAATAIATPSSSSASSSREAILEESRRLREERALVQHRIKSAKSVQRVARGHLGRTYIRRELDRQLLGQQQQQLMSLPQRTGVLNFRLSFRMDDAQWQDCCVDFAKRINDASAAAAAGVSSGGDDPPMCHRILRAVFKLVRRQVHLEACRTVMRYCLRLPLPPPSKQSALPPPNLTQQQQQHQSYYWKQLGGARGYVDLLETLQTALNSDDGSGGSSGGTATTITDDLWELVGAVTPPTLAGKAALAALVLSQKDLFRNEDPQDPGRGVLNSLIARRMLAESGGGGSTTDSSSGSGSSSSSTATWSVFYGDWFYSLVRVLMMVPPAAGTADPMVVATHRIESTAQVTILSNALDLYNRLSSSSTGSHKRPDPAPALRLLQRVLDTRSNLALLSSLLARGEDVQTACALSAPSSSAAAAASRVGNRQDDDDDDDTSYDEEMDTHVRAPPSSAEATTSTQRGRGGFRLTKQDLLTVPQIDRNYHSEVEKWRIDVLTNLQHDTNINSTSFDSEKEAMTVRLATQICDGEQWLNWGLTLLGMPRDSEELWLAQEAYVTLLASMLQSTTGLKARQSAHSPLLTKLAFHQEFVEKLWRYVLVQLTNKQPSQITYVAFSVFSDVFTQRLIALKDDKFLVDHTTLNGPRVILAENVIVRLRNLLYELYWNKPVRAADVKVPFGHSLSDGERFEAVRGRLLLTGTKLWQALYERWCRLVRHSPFCDESTWLFPHMTMTAVGENSVIGMHHPGEMGGDDMDLESDSDDGGGDEPMSTFDEETEGLADAFSDPKMARILTCIPQALPFDRRVKLFSALLTNDKLKTQDEASEMQQSMIMMMRGEEAELSGRERVAIHRDRLYDDSMGQLNKLGPRLRRRVQVTFINQHGAQEAGIDGGGVFKEFIDDLIIDAFSLESSSPRRRLFTVTSLQTLAINSGLTPDPDLLSHYEFLGRVLGKAVYESILVEPQFCLPFLNQLLGKTNSLEDLKNYDPEYYNNLIKLLNLTSDEIDSVGLSFETTLGDGSSSRTVALVPGGRGKHVAKQNVIQYVHLVAHQRLNVESAAQTKAFLRGFRDLIPASWVRLFSAYELQKLISGDDSIRGIDVLSLKAATRYAAGYHPSQSMIQWFWEIVDEMTAEEQRKFLKFMTSCSRQPLLGFASLDPPPCIQQIRLSDDLLRGDPAKTAPLPTSSTCMNLLKLPNYKNKELMRMKLLTAVESGAGFELS